MIARITTRGALCEAEACRTPSRKLVTATLIQEHCWQVGGKPNCFTKVAEPLRVWSGGVRQSKQSESCQPPGNVSWRDPRGAPSKLICCLSGDARDVQRSEGPSGVFSDWDVGGSSVGDEGNNRRKGGAERRW